ncbi:hypothetical protein Lal_00042873 [Lupinus albus]|nr:hypothetical protein Lal_00042873 [Lupinus albus]
MAFFRSACEPIGARRLISVEDKQPSSFPSLPLPGPKAVQANPCPVPGRVKGASILIPYPNLRPFCSNGALLIQGGGVEPREALLRGRSLAPPHFLQGSKPFFNIGDNERGRDGRNRRRE